MTYFYCSSFHIIAVGALYSKSNFSDEWEAELLPVDSSVSSLALCVSTHSADPP